MAARQFSGREIEFLMGKDEDNPYNGVVKSTPLEGTEAGYQMLEVVVKHPDGKLYQFIYYYNDDHGMNWSYEDPDRMFPATEVKAVETITYDYIPVD